MTPTDYREILRTAIQKEKGAAAFYRNLAERMTDAALRQLFDELSREELTHEATLQGYLADESVAMQFDEAHDYGIAKTIDQPDPSPDMTPAAALALAVKNEEAAMKGYLALAEASSDARAKATFQALATMERGHKARLEELYTNIAYAEAW